jgi:hypothetical protein
MNIEGINISQESITTRMYEGIDEATLKAHLNDLRKAQQAEWNSREKPIQDLLRALQSLKPKTCPSCFKSVGEVTFYKNNLRKDKLQVYCSNCMKQKQLHSKKTLSEETPVLEFSPVKRVSL